MHGGLAYPVTPLVQVGEVSLAWWQWVLVALHLLVSLALLTYAVNWYVLLGLTLRSWRHVTRRQKEVRERNLPADRETWPQVLVQLPIYNEKWVARRIIQAAARLDYPRDKLEIQVLDDSNDETSRIIEEEVAIWRAQGVDVRRVTRPTREGYKAGALKFGQALSRAEFIAIFDADFIPDPDWLKKSLPYLLADPRVGLVQTRWGHINRSDSLITRTLALGIDGHFVVEQPGRTWSGLLGNFNGTAGIWRAAAIEDAGGWEGDTLTEDLDLSYRAQLKGWKIEYVPDVSVPAELPDDIRSIKSQQFRWAKGSIQTAIKLLRRVWAAPIGIAGKVQATLHLTTYLIHPLMLASVALSLPLLTLADREVPVVFAIIGAAIFGMGFAAPTLMYATSQILLYRYGWRRLWLLPILLALGMGIAVSNTRAVWEAVRGRRSPFVRTPKRGSRAGIGEYRQPLSWWFLLDLIAGAYCAVTGALYSACGIYPVAALLGVYAIGFTTVGLLTLRGETERISQVSKPRPQVALGDVK